MFDIVKTEVVLKDFETTVSVLAQLGSKKHMTQNLKQTKIHVTPFIRGN